MNWLYPQFVDGTYRLRSDDLLPYVEAIPKQATTLTDRWTSPTVLRVASGLLRIAVDFGLMTGSQAREFASYHLPDESFLYLLHVMAEQNANASTVVRSPDWRMYLMSPEDVERELFRLHQLKKLHYEVAGSLTQLKLPCSSAVEYAKELVA